MCVSLGKTHKGGCRGNYVGTFVCVRGVLRISTQFFVMLNARLVDMVAIELNVGLFSIC